MHACWRLVRTGLRVTSLHSVCLDACRVFVYLAPFARRNSNSSLPPERRDNNGTANIPTNDTCYQPQRHHPKPHAWFMHCSLYCACTIFRCSRRAARWPRAAGGPGGGGIAGGTCRLLVRLRYYFLPICSCEEVIFAILSRNSTITRPCTMVRTGCLRIVSGRRSSTETATASAKL